MNQVIGFHRGNTTGTQNDYKDYINYKPGDDMLNSDLPGLRAASMIDTRATEER